MGISALINANLVDTDSGRHYLLVTSCHLSIPGIRYAGWEFEAIPLIQLSVWFWPLSDNICQIKSRLLHITRHPHLVTVVRQHDD